MDNEAILDAALAISNMRARQAETLVVQQVTAHVVKSNH